MLAERGRSLEEGYFRRKSIADASGEMRGIIGRVSAEKREILATVATGLKGRASGHRESA